MAASGLGAEETSEGAKTYQLFCSACHGKSLEGSGSAKSLVDGTWSYGGGRGYMFRNIKFGILNLGMPAWENALSDERINQVIDYILEKEKEEDPAPHVRPQTYTSRLYTVGIEPVIDAGLRIPWSVAFPDDETILITERPGTVRIAKNGVLDPDPIADTPEVLHAGQGGLLDITLDPDFKDNGWIYLAYSHPIERDGATLTMTRIVRGHIRDHAWVDQKVIFEANHEHYLPTRHHYGSKIAFDSEGHLFFSIGDRGSSEHAQDITRPNGKIHRIWPDGTIPESNPFYDHPDAVQSIYSYGHRNPQGVAVDLETDQVWATEHGPMGGDEVNLSQPGLNYGWPEITYGRNYNGTEITPLTSKEGMEQPKLYWTPSIAPCGLEVYSGNLFPEWKGNLLAGSLKYEELHRLSIEDSNIVDDEVILKGAGRIRDIVNGPGGAIYVITNNPDALIRLVPE